MENDQPFTPMVQWRWMSGKPANEDLAAFLATQFLLPTKDHISTRSSEADASGMHLLSGVSREAIEKWFHEADELTALVQAFMAFAHGIPLRGTEWTGLQAETVRLGGHSGQRPRNIFVRNGKICFRVLETKNQAKTNFRPAMLFSNEVLDVILIPYLCHFLPARNQLVKIYAMLGESDEEIRKINIEWVRLLEFFLGKKIKKKKTSFDIDFFVQYRNSTAHFLQRATQLNLIHLRIFVAMSSSTWPLLVGIWELTWKISICQLYVKPWRHLLLFSRCFSIGHLARTSKGF